MRRFKRKKDSDEVAVRCPNCHEHVPEGEHECTMCGHSLADEHANRASSDVAAGATRPT